MTILIGTIFDNRAYIGADTLWTWSENFVRKLDSSKFINLSMETEHELLIATAGQDKFTQILEKVLANKPELANFKNRAGLLKLLDEFQKEVKHAGVGDAENNQLPDHELGFMIATSAAPKIWVVESDYGILEFNDHVCSGSGAFLGEAAMRALEKSEIYGEKAIRLALETVCELHPFCGGDLEIKSIELETD